MKRLIAIAGLTALVACNQAETEPEAEPAAEETVAAVTVANGSPPGVYIATAPDGSETTTTISADGSYIDTDAEGNVLAEGTWAVIDGKTCFSPTTAGVEAMCYTETAPGPDGSFTATPDSGDPVTVRPAAAATE